MLKKFDNLVNFSAVSSKGADRNTNFEEQLQDTVNLLEMKIFLKKTTKVLDSTEIKLSTVTDKCSWRPSF